jgi:hypothetical protein
MQRRILESLTAPAALLFSLTVSFGVCAQATTADYCDRPVSETETLTTGVDAEINDHGDLLLLLDTDEDGNPERALHGAPRNPDELTAYLEALGDRAGPITIRFLSRSTVAFSGFEVIDEQGNVALRALSGMPECYPDDEQTDLWLNGLAHYTLSKFQPMANWTIDNLRKASLTGQES